MTPGHLSEDPPLLIDGEEALAAFRSNWFSVRHLGPRHR